MRIIFEKKKHKRNCDQIYRNFTKKRIIYCTISEAKKSKQSVFNDDRDEAKSSRRKRKERKKK